MIRRTFIKVISCIPVLLFATPQMRPQCATERQRKLKWGTYGKNACNYPNLEWKSLEDCDDDHLLAILETQHQITEEYVQAITNILLDRGIPCTVISQRTSSFLASKMSSSKSLPLV